MIKAIFFDLDGVLTTDKTGSVTSCKYFAEKLNADYQILFDKKHTFDEAIDKGEVDNATIWEQISSEVGIPFNPEWITEAFKSTPVDGRMTEFVRSLKSKYKVGIITDNETERVDVICKMHGWYDIFNPIIVSQTVGSTKRDIKIFEVAIEGLGVNPKECIFIDNTMRNVESSNKFGMHSVYFDDEVRDYETLKVEIEKITKECENEMIYEVYD